MRKDPTGLYNKRVTLRYPTGAKDPVTNEPVYVDGVTVWSAWDVRPPHGRVIHVENMEAATQTRWIKIRYVPGIKHDWRVKYGTQEYNIVQPPIDMGLQHREIYLELQVI